MRRPDRLRRPAATSTNSRSNRRLPYIPARFARSRLRRGSRHLLTHMPRQRLRLTPPGVSQNLLHPPCGRAGSAPHPPGKEFAIAHLDAAAIKPILSALLRAAARSS